MGDWRAFDWEGSNYLLDRLSVGTNIHSVAMESPVLSPTSRKAPDLIRRQHIVVVIQERTFGRILQSVHPDFLIHRTVSDQARPAHVYHSAIREFEVDRPHPTARAIPPGLRESEPKYNVASGVPVEREVQLVAGQGGAVDVFVKEPVQTMIAL